MDKFMKDSSVADALGIHRVTLWRWAREGKFPAPVKLSTGSTRWRESDVKAWQESILIGGQNG
jgi:predicted DNA-binding transcriptional regulator AlpA